MGKLNSIPTDGSKDNSSYLELFFELVINSVHMWVRCAFNNFQNNHFILLSLTSIVGCELCFDEMLVVAFFEVFAKICESCNASNIFGNKFKN